MKYNQKEREIYSTEKKLISRNEKYPPFSKKKVLTSKKVKLKNLKNITHKNNTEKIIIHEIIFVIITTSF
jgi:hypothetical protein